MNYNGIPFLKIRDNYQHFHKKEKQIADEILKNADRVVYQSIKELAHECGTSESSIVRFCKLLGYSGFIELKLELAKSAFESSGDTDTSSDGNMITSNDEDNITKALFSNISNFFHRITDAIDYKEIDNATDAILKSNLLFVSGYIYSGQIAYAFHERMNALGIPTFIAFEQVEMQRNVIMASKDTSYIFLSHSGASKQSIECAQLAKNRGAVIIVITTAAAAPLAKLADILIIIPTIGNSLTESYYPTELAFQTVLAAIHEKAVTAKYNNRNISDRTEQFEYEILKSAIIS